METPVTRAEARAEAERRVGQACRGQESAAGGRVSIPPPVLRGERGLGEGAPAARDTWGPGREVAVTAVRPGVRGRLCLWVADRLRSVSPSSPPRPPPLGGLPLNGTCSGTYTKGCFSRNFEPRRVTVFS